MELFGTSTGEWNSFNGDSSEEADFMVQLLCNDYSDEQDPCLTLGTPSSSTWPFHESTMNMTAYGGGGGDSSYYCSDITNSSTHNLYYHHPQEVNYTSHSSPIIMANNDNTFSMNLLSMNQQNDCSSIKMFLDNVIEDPVSVCFKQETSNGSLSYQSCEDPRENFVGKRKLMSSEPNTTTEDDINLLQTSKRKKQSQVSEDGKVKTQAEKNKKNGESKKNQKLEEDEKEMKTNSGGTNIKNSCSYSSEEDESNASEQDINGGSISRRMSRKNDKQSLKGKTRASRGSATDPQSLYARKRRERINERLRVLQNLVPNGTKVDISTMLEEAVQYVKFLQLQIKLLSSDDHWMYSPIAYNGMDIGLGSKIPATR